MVGDYDDSVMRFSETLYYALYLLGSQSELVIGFEYLAVVHHLDDLCLRLVIGVDVLVA